MSYLGCSQDTIKLWAKEEMEELQPKESGTSWGDASQECWLIISLNTI